MNATTQPASAIVRMTYGWHLSLLMYWVPAKFKLVGFELSSIIFVCIYLYYRLYMRVS